MPVGGNNLDANGTREYIPGIISGTSIGIDGVPGAILLCLPSDNVAYSICNSNINRMSCSVIPI